MKQTFGRGYPALYYSILLYLILSIATVTNKVYFARICSHYARTLLFAFAFPYYSNNFAGKIDASLAGS